MENFIIIAVLAIIIGAAIIYIIKSKKSGVKCIGCPSGATCAHKCKESSNCASCCGCSEEKN